MKKDDILNLINSIYKHQFEWSEPISDKKYLQKRGIPNVKGYGIYDVNAKNRYCLCIDIQNHSRKSLTVLLMNPSTTLPPNIAKRKNKKSRFDQTIRNLIRLAHAKDYSQVIILNTFPYIESDSKKANEYYKKYKPFEKNVEFVEKILANSRKVLIACGDKVETNLYDDYIKIIANIKGKTKLYTYTTEFTKIGKRPRHLSLQSEANRKLYEIALTNKELFELDIVDNNFILKD